MERLFSFLTYFSFTYIVTLKLDNPGKVSPTGYSSKLSLRGARGVGVRGVSYSRGVP